MQQLGAFGADAAAGHVQGQVVAEVNLRVAAPQHSSAAQGAERLDHGFVGEFGDGFEFQQRRALTEHRASLEGRAGQRRAERLEAVTDQVLNAWGDRLCVGRRAGVVRLEHFQQVQRVAARLPFQPRGVAVARAESRGQF